MVILFHNTFTDFFPSIILGNTLKSLANYQTDFPLLVRDEARAVCTLPICVVEQKERNF